jgi:DNA-directed RNA polymerase specialized sigma24 family protein
MRKRSKLSNKQQKLAADWAWLVPMLAKFFVQNRPAWQRGLLVEDLEGEGYLAISKAARTYDPKRLPYPKAYFARSVLNSMYKHIKRATRTPAEWRVSIEEAGEALRITDEPDYLRLAIEDLGEEAELATDRFRHGHTLRQIAETHSISLRLSSVRCRDLATRIADALDIRLSPLAKDKPHPGAGTTPSRRASARACERHPHKGEGQFPAKTNPRQRGGK